MSQLDKEGTGVSVLAESKAVVTRPAQPLPPLYPPLVNVTLIECYVSRVVNCNPHYTVSRETLPLAPLTLYPGLRCPPSRPTHLPPSRYSPRTASPLPDILGY